MNKKEILRVAIFFSIMLIAVTFTMRVSRVEKSIVIIDDTPQVIPDEDVNTGVLISVDDELKLGMLHSMLTDLSDNRKIRINPEFDPYVTGTKGKNEFNRLSTLVYSGYHNDIIAGIAWLHNNGHVTSFVIESEVFAHADMEMRDGVWTVVITKFNDDGKVVVEE